MQYDGAPRTAVTITYFYSGKQEVAVGRDPVDLIQEFDTHHGIAAQCPIGHECLFFVNAP